VQIDWWTLGLQTINAVVLLWLLTHFFFRPVSDIMKKRQEEAGRITAEAEAAKAEARKAADEASAQVAKLAGEHARVLKDAATEAEKMRAAARTEAEGEARKIRDDARVAAEAFQARLEADAAGHASLLATSLAAKLLARLPDSALVDGFVTGLSEAIGKLPEETRRTIGADLKPVRLLAARPLSETEEAACRQAIEEALGHAASLEITIEPALIAGLELEAPYALAKNSFRADLETLSGELQHHD
jgi:F-type H+-transporting ATPase subunit b